MWTRSSKDYSFVKTCKSTIRCVYLLKESNKVIYINYKYFIWIDIPEGQLNNESKA